MARQLAREYPWLGLMSDESWKYDAYRVLDSSSVSKVPCLLSSSRRLTVTIFSLSLDSLSEMGGVTPRCLWEPQRRETGD